MRIIASILLATSAGAYPVGLADAWGGWYGDYLYSGGRLEGSHSQYNGALSNPVTVYQVSSYSPWLGLGLPDADYETARGTVWTWRAWSLSGSNWRRLADGTIERSRIILEDTESEPPAPKYFSGSYSEGSAALGVRVLGTLWWEVQNSSERAYDCALYCEWAWAEGGNHSTIDRLTVTPARLNGCIPQPAGLFGWLLDYDATALP